ncbi:MerR family transcriptional regulator [Segetibacter koreensis]|uniref:MerR family transcriptional regulator n=1 Tax=Segetibacter koreensis TaxID=398037 RepID=UPI0003651308|nr:MerR family transcriptional regulator [Segetibacter koreensis]
MYYFYTMRQLDLFGTLFDTPPQEEESGKDQSVVKNEEAITPVSNSEQTHFSLVELAEETLGATAFPWQNEIPGTDKANTSAKNDIKAEEKESLVFSNNEVFIEKSAEVTNVEKLQVRGETFDSANQLTNEEKDEIQKELNPQKSERNGLVVFDNGKISVKVKAKPVVIPVAEPKEEVRKEPQKRGRKSIKEIEAEVDLVEVPEDEILFQKQYYSISEVAKWFRVNTSLIRFWENEFDVLKPRKNRKGDRLFRPEDVKTLQLIYQLLRERKYTIEGAKEYIKTNRKKADIELQLTNSLQKFKSFLLDLKANL